MIELATGWPAQQRLRFMRPPSRSVRETWAEWFRRHGVDPHDVALLGWIERRELDYQLTYESFERRPADGSLVKDPATAAIVMVVRVFQLEGPPLPFPTLPHAPTK